MHQLAIFQTPIKSNDFVIDNMMPGITADLTSIAATPSGRATKGGFRIWPDTLSGPCFHPSG
jgi:hypothetical protein